MTQTPIMSSLAKQQPHIQMWLEDASGEGFGCGRIGLLRLIHELGSLSRAAKQLGMSYRAAWGKIKKAEDILNVVLVESAGAKRDGYRLTASGHELIHLFEMWSQDVTCYAMKRAQEIFICERKG